MIVLRKMLVLQPNLLIPQNPMPINFTLQTKLNDATLKDKKVEGWFKGFQVKV